MYGENIICNPHQHNMVHASDFYSLLMSLIHKSTEGAYVAVSLEKSVCKCQLMRDLKKKP